MGVWHALGLAAASYAFVFVGMMCVVSLAVLFSTFTNSSLTAVAVALVLVIIMEVLGAIPQFDFLQPYLFPSKFMEWMNFLRSPVEWAPVIKAFINFAVWIVGTTGIAVLEVQPQGHPVVERRSLRGAPRRWRRVGIVSEPSLMRA